MPERTVVQLITEETVPHKQLVDLDTRATRWWLQSQAAISIRGVQPAHMRMGRAAVPDFTVVAEVRIEL